MSRSRISVASLHIFLLPIGGIISEAQEALKNLADGKQDLTQQKAEEVEVSDMLHDGWGVRWVVVRMMPSNRLLIAALSSVLHPCRPALPCNRWNLLAGC